MHKWHWSYKDPYKRENLQKHPAFPDLVESPITPLTLHSAESLLTVSVFLHPVSVWASHSNEAQILTHADGLLALLPLRHSPQMVLLLTSLSSHRSWGLPFWILSWRQPSSFDLSWCCRTWLQFAFSAVKMGYIESSMVIPKVSLMNKRRWLCGIDIQSMGQSSVWTGGQGWDWPMAQVRALVFLSEKVEISISEQLSQLLQHSHTCCPSSYNNRLNCPNKDKPLHRL